MTRGLHVLLCNYESPPAAGGAGFATFHIGRELARMGVSTDLLTARIEAEPSVTEVDGMRIFRVPSWRKATHDCGLIGAYSYIFFALLKRYRLLSSTPYDVEHFFFGLPTGVLSRSPLPWRAPPYVVSLRGSDVPGYDPFNHTVERLHRLLLPMTRRIWRQAGSVVALSDALKMLALQTTPELPIDVIPNGVDTDHFRPPAETARVTESDRPLALISVARLLERKGLHHLFEAIAKPTPLPVTLTVVGTGPYQPELERQVGELGLSDRVSFAGFVRHAQLADMYRASDLFVLPSQTESFGLVFAEAMASGLPVLATQVGGIPELVRDGTDGLLVEPARPDQLRGALERLLAGPEERLAMGRQARGRIEAHYSWRAIAERYLATYESILAHPQHDTARAAGVMRGI